MTTVLLYLIVALVVTDLILSAVHKVLRVRIDRWARGIAIGALQDDRETAVQALLMIEQVGMPPSHRIASEALDRLEVERVLPARFFEGEQ